MFRALDDFVALWEQESAGTLRVLERLTDASLAQQIDPEGRTLGQLAWHVALAPAGMLSQAGLGVESGAQEGDDLPAEAAAIVEAYRTVSRSAGEAVRAWKDEDLGGEVKVFGQSWSRAQLLTVLLLHQSHHRGQMTVLMRQAGLSVPGVAGPSREEWAAVGAPAPE